MKERHGRKLLEDILNRHSPWRRIAIEDVDIAYMLKPACLMMLKNNPIDGLEDFEDGHEGLTYYTLLDEKGECILQVSDNVIIEDRSDWISAFSSDADKTWPRFFFRAIS